MGRPRVRISEYTNKSGTTEVLLSSLRETEAFLFFTLFYHFLFERKEQYEKNQDF